VPVGRTVSLRMGSGDVIHSFWVPQFAGKRDVFPNRETRIWFKAEASGNLPGQCAEFCGIQHGRMAFRIRAQSPAEFQAWVAHMQTLGPKPPAASSAAPADTVRTASAGANVQAAQGKPAPKSGADSAQARAPAPPSDPAYAAGEKLFTAKGCVGCHSLVAVNAPEGMIGPNLANVGARSFIGAGSFKNTDENLARWIQNPQALKKGVLMPNLGVTPDEAKSLVAFLRAHQ
jgi:cytochrome c oxidase subunit II